ncbi:AsnC family protein [Sinorhizobium meliloti]|uniref:AsnC family protein n=1 Tax=Rhizobium meliloti TaxID=382 RepID=UPI003F17562C
MTFAKGQKARNRKLPADSEIIKLFNAGLSNAEMAARIGCTAQAIGNRLNRLGLTRKKPEPVEPVPPATRPNVVCRQFSWGTVSLPIVRGWYGA